MGPVGPSLAHCNPLLIVTATLGRIIVDARNSMAGSLGISMKVPVKSALKLKLRYLRVDVFQFDGHLMLLFDVEGLVDLAERATADFTCDEIVLADC